VLTKICRKSAFELPVRIPSNNQPRLSTEISNNMLILDSNQSLEGHKFSQRKDSYQYFNPSSGEPRAWKVIFSD